MIMTTLLLWGCLLLGFEPQATDGASKATTLAEVVDQLRKRENLFFSVDSIHIKTSWGATDHLFMTSAQEAVFVDMLKRLRFDAKAFPQQQIFRTPGYKHELGKRGIKFFQKVINPLDLKFGALGLTGVYDGTIGLELQERSHATIAATPPAWSWQNWDYAFLLHFDILKYVKGLDQRKQLPEAVRPLNLPEDMDEFGADYSIAGQDSVDGVTCLLLDKSDKVRFWLDPNQGCAIRRVDRFIAGKQRAPGSLQSTVTMSDYRQAQPGLWLPWAIKEQLYYTSERGPSQLVGQPAVQRVLSVESMEFNTLTDEFFQVPLPSDVLVHDNIQNIQYYNQKAGIPFAKAIEFADRKRDIFQAGSRWSSMAMLIVGNLILVCAIAWLLYSRRNRSNFPS